MPARPWLFRQTWSDLAFIHCRIDAAQLRPLIPSPLKVQDYDGSAWLGIVPFRMRQVAPRGWPLPGALPAFPELNVRTYVEHGGKPGVWFFSLDASSRLMVEAGRRLFGLPYFPAAIRLASAAGAFALTSTRRDGRARWSARYRATGPRLDVRPGSFEHWATERYCLYARHPGGRLQRVEVHHVPWPLHPAEAEIAETTLLAAAGLTPGPDAPVCHFSPGVQVVSFGAEPIA